MSLHLHQTRGGSMCNLGIKKGRRKRKRGREQELAPTRTQKIPSCLTIHFTVFSLATVTTTTFAAKVTILVTILRTGGTVLKNGRKGNKGLVEMNESVSHPPSQSPHLARFTHQVATFSNVFNLHTISTTVATSGVIGSEVEKRGKVVQTSQLAFTIIKKNDPTHVSLPSHTPSPQVSGGKKSATH